MTEIGSCFALVACLPACLLDEQRIECPYPKSGDKNNKRTWLECQAEGTMDIL